MSLLNLFPVAPNTPNATIRICCQKCLAESQYDVAQDAGWKFDPKGEAFKSYYCPPCAEERSTEEAAEILRDAVAAIEKYAPAAVTSMLRRDLLNLDPSRLS